MKITISKKERFLEFDIDEEERILYGGLSKQIPLPYECATGTCGTCKARLISGEVTSHWDSAPGRAKLKIARDEFLMCQSSCKTDIEIKVPGINIDQVATNPVPSQHTGIISSIDWLTSDVAHVSVDLDRQMNFKSGQFVVVESDLVAGGRAYSMVNYDPGTKRLELVIKLKSGGGFSTWLSNEASVGKRFNIFGPLGCATFDPSEDKDLLCICGGSGIAGIMSILEHAFGADHFSRFNGELYFGVRTPADAFYLQQLSRYVSLSNGRLTVTVVFSESFEVDTNSPLPTNLKYKSGFVGPVAIESTNTAVENASSFLAGPPIMIDGVIRSLIIDKGFAPNQIKYDKFA
ncbi:MAG: toluene monooxygenase electron transfer component [Parasphingorhabdus sp.]|jgi:toluene monooxygenase electron transfer component